MNLESPTQNTEAVDGEVLIKGKTLPNTTVVLFNNTDEMVIESDSSGGFASNMVLAEGENAITVTAFKDNGEEKTLSVSINYNSKT